MRTLSAVLIFAAAIASRAPAFAADPFPATGAAKLAAYSVCRSSLIVEMGPGMIIQFEKSCEEMLELEVGDRKVAFGEAIKVGDKFGIRVTSIILPEERFNTVKPRKRVSR